MQYGLSWMQGGSVSSLAVKSEILTALCSTQLVFTDPRSPVYPDVVCSDASMSGVGACMSTGFSDEVPARFHSDEVPA